MNFTAVLRPLIGDWLYYESWLEVFVMVPTLMLNIYFTIRISQLSTFSVNFRIIITVQTILTSLIALVHPLQYFLPETFYSFKDGNYYSAMVTYGVHGALHFALFLIESKYLLIAIERLIAFNQRTTYEKRNCSVAFKILGVYFVFSTVCFYAKTRFLWQSYSDLPIDARLRKVVMFDRDYYGYSVNYALSALSTVAAIYIFYHIHCQLLRRCAEFCTLSERFEVRQTQMMLNYAKSLVTAFVILLITCGVSNSAVAYLKFVEGRVEDDPEIVFVYVFVYISLCLYNFTAMLYMIRSFPQLQKVILNDLPFLKRKGTDLVKPERVADTELHFGHLRKSWK
ncbi:unnamed protein product [Bursaphelenchus xylophilus]|uniref:(pine wood nematode) hypothetical protein n=1 Tax=Bursaphelenchus xylophilus TaxID=6326 RepID=A0A1I7S4J8_BURXY|nr:unnamed protein product [Bursaphelenchus xylophilus]CAG9117177.1 unnamed protein product [Bursaphelenchus xylophilus]